MSGPAPFTVAAGQVVHGHDALAAVPLRDDLVTEDCTGEPGPAELLDIRAAESAGEDGDELPVVVRIVHFAQVGSACAVEHDRAHHSSRPKNELDRT